MVRVLIEVAEPDAGVVVERIERHGPFELADSFVVPAEGAEDRSEDEVGRGRAVV